MYTSIIYFGFTAGRFVFNSLTRVATARHVSKIAYGPLDIYILNVHFDSQPPDVIYFFSS